MQPITIASTRIYSSFDIETIIALTLTLALAAAAATVLARLKHRRD
jgi:hypothetical protein